MIPKNLPAPAQIAAYLTARGWSPEWPLEPEGAMFVFEEPADDGQPITVFVPSSSEVTHIHYPLAVSAVVDTVSGIEERPKEAVWADLGATAAPNIPPTPTLPATPPAPVDPVTP